MKKLIITPSYYLMKYSNPVFNEFEEQVVLKTGPILSVTLALTEPISTEEYAQLL